MKLVISQVDLTFGVVVKDCVLILFIEVFNLFRVLSCVVDKEILYRKSFPSHVDMEDRIA